MLVTVYNFKKLIQHIECHKDTIDIVLCGEGDAFYINYEVVYLKNKGFLVNLTGQRPKICGSHFTYGESLWAIIIYNDNLVEQMSVGKEAELSEHQLGVLTGEYLKYAIPDYADLGE